MKNKYYKLILILAAMLVSLLSGAGIDVLIRPANVENILKDGFSIEISSKQVPAAVAPSIPDSEIVTVEEVDGGEIFQQILDDINARGSYYDTSSYEAFINATQGQCVIEGNIYGAQCVSLAQAFWTNYAGRAISTCGTGAARGIAECSEYNAGTEFEYTTDVSKIIPGTWIVTNGGTWGHIAMAVGYYNNGYLAVYGENQGGEKCPEGGSKPNVINLSMNTFLGAFIPKTYIPIPQPDPVIPISGCSEWFVKRGDTMGKIMMECEGTIHYGEIMNEYAKTWYSLIYRPNQSVYDGWNSPSGVGLYAGDNIEHRF